MLLQHRNKAAESRDATSPRFQSTWPARFAELFGYPLTPPTSLATYPPWGEWSDARQLGPRGRTRVPVPEATDKPATPWSVAAILPGSGVAQLGTTPSGQTLSGDEEQGSELLTFSLRKSANWCVLGPTEGATTHHP